MRKFLGISLLVFLTCILVFSGCTKTSTTSQTTTTSQEPTGPTGEIVYVVDNMGTDNFNVNATLPPAWAEIPGERWMRFQYDNESPGFYPLLAEKWEFAPDYSYMDVYVRQGVQWQGGYGELTAEDFEYTFSVIHTDDSKGSLESWWWAPPEMGGFIASTEVIDKYHWRINFSAVPYTAFLADADANYFVICCKKYFEAVGYDKAIQEPIGTGPWQLIEHVPGSYMKFEAFEDYWGTKPNFKYLTIKCVPEMESQIAMLETGEADIAAITPDKITEVEAAGIQVKDLTEANAINLRFGGQLLSTDPNFDPTVPWASHTDEPSDSDWNQRALKVRQALNLAIDRAAIRDKIMYGACTPMTTYLYTPSNPGYKSEWTEYPYDPNQAKQLLSEAGYPNGFEKPITMLVDTGNTYSGPNGKAIALAIADEFEAIGLQVTRQIVDNTALTEAWAFGHQDAWCMSVYSMIVYWYPTDWWQWTLASNAPMHDAFMHPEFDKYCLEYNQAATKGEEEQIRIMQEGTDWIYKNYMFAPIAYQDMIYAFGPKIGELSKYEVYFANAQSALNFEFLTHAK